MYGERVVIDHGREEELVRSLTDVVADHLHVLQEIDERTWWPHTFFAWLEKDDESVVQAKLKELRENARALPIGVLISLVGNMITEEALPNYSARLANLFPDETGIGMDPWQQWQRGWNAEEDTHGDILKTYARLSGRFNMLAVEKTIFGLIKAGMENSPSVVEGILYPTFQEEATRIAHVKTGTMVKKLGAPTIGTICQYIAADEARHHRFYTGVSKGLMEADPETTIIALHRMYSHGIIMPARLMTDGETQAPTLYDNFAAVTQDNGIYTFEDYVDVSEKVLRDLDVEHQSVSGDAAKAQERLMKLPRRVRRVGERKAKQPREPFGFSWVHYETA